MIDFEENVRSHLVEKCSGAKGMLEYGVKIQYTLRN